MEYSQELDDSVGQVLSALERRGVRNNTLVYFASDNGPFREEGAEGGSCGFGPLLAPGAPLVSSVGAAAGAAAAHGGPRAARRLKGGKQQTWECGIRVPAVLSYPARWPAGLLVHASTSTMDLLPTVLRLAGVSVGGGAGARLRHVSELRAGEKAGAGVLDGRDLSPLLEGALAGELHEFVMHHCGGRIAAVRHGRYKAHFTTARWLEEASQTCRRSVICACAGRTHEPPLLYDIHADPAELSPLDPALPPHAAAIERIKHARAQHEATIVDVPSQNERLPSRLTHLPCCGAAPGSWEHAWKVLSDGCGC